MDAKPPVFLPSITEAPIDAPLVTGPSQVAEEDAFTTDIMKSLSTAQYDDGIIEFINLLNPGPEHRVGAKNNDPVPDHGNIPFSSNDWEEHRAELEVLYSEKNYKLKDIMRIMEDKYRLSAGETQYRRKFARWGLEKNVKFNEMRKIIQIWMRRKQEGKESEFLVRNKPVSLAKIERFQRRTRASVTESSPGWPTPSQITYFTPQLVSTTSLTGNVNVNSSSVEDVTDATEQTLDLLSLYMTANFQPTLDPSGQILANFRTPTTPEQLKVAPAIPRTPRPTLDAFGQTIENLDVLMMPGQLEATPDILQTPRWPSVLHTHRSYQPSGHGGRAARISEKDLNRFMSAQWQKQYWKSSKKEPYFELAGTDTMVAALKESLVPSYHLASVWSDSPNLEQALFYMENSILGLGNSTIPPEDEDINQLLERAIINDDRDTVILVLRYHHKHKPDFESRCPVYFLHLAKNFNRYELFGILILNGLLKDYEAILDLDRLAQAQCYLQYGYLFLPHDENHDIFFLLLYRLRIATHTSITSWLFDALVNGHGYALAVLNQYKHCWDLDFILSQAVVLYHAIQRRPECLSLIHMFIIKEEDDVLSWQQLQLFLATALLQNTVLEHILGGRTTVNIKNHRGHTALHHVATIDYGDGAEITNTLLRHGIKVDTKDCSGNTCLHSAFQSTWNPWKEKFIRTMIEAKADINAQNLLGQTCLAIVATHWEVSQAEEMMEWLTSLGADPTIVNGQGQTPSQTLESRKH